MRQSAWVNAVSGSGRARRCYPCGSIDQGESFFRHPPTCLKVCAGRTSNRLTEFMDVTQNAVLIFGLGTGKTHVTCLESRSSGMTGVNRFFSTIELVNTLEQKKPMYNGGKLTESLARLDLMILDELDHLPDNSSGGMLPFQ
jgi:DNA replication protein DnaC